MSEECRDRVRLYGPKRPVKREKAVDAIGSSASKLHYEQMRARIRRIELDNFDWQNKVLQHEVLARQMQLNLEIESLRKTWILRDLYERPLKTEGLKCVMCSVPLPDRDNGRPQKYCRPCFMQHRTDYFARRYLRKKAEKSLEPLFNVCITRKEAKCNV